MKKVMVAIAVLAAMSVYSVHTYRQAEKCAEYDVSSIKTMEVVMPQTEKAETSSETKPMAVQSAESSEEAIYIEIDVPLPQDLQEAAERYCSLYEVSPEVLYAVMFAESRFKSDARNGNCVGLMQINKINVEWLNQKIGITDLEVPEQNIQAGAYILGEYLKKYTLIETLMAYNNGEGGAKKLWDQGIFSTAYTDKVLSAMEEMK